MTRQQLTVEGLWRIAIKGAQYGAVRSTWSTLDPVTGEYRAEKPRFRQEVRWDVSGRCWHPLAVELHSRYSAVYNRKVKPMTIVLDVPCRRCGWCKNKRRNMWAAHAVQEYHAAERTWFATLTLEPEEHYRALTTARLRYADFDALTNEQRFARLVAVIGRDLTLFCKRVRKNSRAKMRYLMVAEAHKSGLPHFHMLIHEMDALRPIRKAVLKEAWRLGFSKFALAHDPRGAVYLCKYLAKDASTRIRASFRYGRMPSERSLLHRLPDNRERLTPERPMALSLDCQEKAGL